MTFNAAFIHEPAPEHPGWLTWNLDDDSRFNAVGLGPMIIRGEGERNARVRLLELERRHSNMHGNVHGGVTLAFIDVAMFAATYSVLGAAVSGSVTLDLHNQFIGAARIGQPLDVVCEVMRETGRLVFLRGTAEQGDTLVSSFVGTLRKPSVR